ncbi:MAG: hypothetical protein JWQ01_4860 [Massilia sp.]|nr:hypothetical protein [Massilia sp.]
MGAMVEFSAMPNNGQRAKLTLNWRGATERLPDFTFYDVTVDAPPPPLPELRSEAPPIPPIPPKTAHEQHYENVVLLLDRWAEWSRTGGETAEGAPTQSTFAPDARIHSFEDMEIAVDKLLVGEMNTAVWELQVMEREAVMTHYGLKTRGVWQARFETIFDQAVDSLFRILKNRIAC